MKISANTSSEPLCQWIFEYADFGIILTDNDLRITDVNQWIEDRSGRQRILLTGKPIVEVFPEIRFRGLDHYLTDALGGASVILSARFHNYFIQLKQEVTGSENEYMKQNVKISSLLYKRAVTGLLIHIEDVTERLKREELLQIKNEELEKLNSTKDKFFKIISHDLRSPFSSLIGLSEILMEDEDLAPDQVKEIIAMLNISLKNEYNLLENLLKWSQLQSGKMELNYHEVTLIEIINNILNIAAPVMRSKKINLVTSGIPEDLTLVSDYQALNTILHNLIFNALKYTYTGGKIEIDAFKSSESIIISIQDTGIGIAEDRISKLFKIDELVSTPGTSDESGSGLGLILVKDLIDKLNGEVWVKSIPTKGSTFYVSLPPDKIPEHGGERETGRERAQLETKKTSSE